MTTKVKKINIEVVKSIIGRNPNHVKIMKSLGLKKIGEKVSHNATADILGKIKKVSYLLKVEEVNEKWN